ncbi:MAG: hypothetical protein ACI81L_002499 [Verrucomicrobiales bacterium]|jgi:hypothetical protein
MIVTTATSPIDIVVRRYFDSFALAEPDITASFVSPDFINEHTAALGSDCVGREAYRARLPGFLRDMDGLEYKIENLVIDDEAGQAAAFYTMTARWQGEAPFSVRGAQRLVIVDGLITHRTDYWDSAVFLSQANESARKDLAKYGIS